RHRLEVNFEVVNSIFGPAFLKPGFDGGRRDFQNRRGTRRSFHETPVEGDKSFHILSFPFPNRAFSMGCAELGGPPSPPRAPAFRPSPYAPRLRGLKRPFKISRSAFPAPGFAMRPARRASMIADAHGATPRQAALAFLVRRPSLFAIPKAANARHAEDK